MRQEVSLSVVVHLAAQAGVAFDRKSRRYIKSNLLGFQNILENCRQSKPQHLVFASSSSVYGNSRNESSKETDPTDDPVSLYAATKKANEVVGQVTPNFMDFR